MTLGEICKGIDLLPASQKRMGLEHWLDMEVRSTTGYSKALLRNLHNGLNQ